MSHVSSRWQSRSLQAFLVLALIAVSAVAFAPSASAQISAQACIKANVVALDQPFFWNRLGATQPHGMMYALERDVVHVSQDESSCTVQQLPLIPGQVRLRKGKRPRPLTLRMHEGGCLEINFRNLLADPRFDGEQPATRHASIHVVGMQYRAVDPDSGMHAGTNTGTGVVPSGGSVTYRLYAEKEGQYLMYNGGVMVGGDGDGGSIGAGLFGAVNVQPAGTRFFRSQVSEKDLGLATTAYDVNGFPTINYTATYTNGSDPEQCRRLGSPILEMVDSGNNLVHSDLTAIITGPSLWTIPSVSEEVDNPVYPHGQEPYREFTIIFHDELGAVQAFPHFQDEVLSHTLGSVRDAFAINYGTGGIGAEILANRLGVGPMHDCVDCAYEEFFLSAWTVGDPAMVVDVPANVGVGNPNRPACMQTAGNRWTPQLKPTKELKTGNNCLPQLGPKATKAFYPDDPSNVYHSYINDHVKFRNLLAGTDDHHIFHLHAHQWLNSPNSDQSSYHDSQAIGQGSGFTYEIAYEGSGNRNKTVGDSIFHCHFYPHFAQGMWSMWRSHDVLELGTKLDANGRPQHEKKFEEVKPTQVGLSGRAATLIPGVSQVITTTRALPDPEIPYGTPIPGIVPIPGKPMAPVPSPVRLINGQIHTNYVTNQAVNRLNSGNPYYNPGYPFFIPGIAGSRPPKPPLDTIVDGGLPRHIITDGEAESWETRLNFAKHALWLEATSVPEAGTTLEQVAMQFHSSGTNTYFTPSAGGPSPTRAFWLNAAGAIGGAPYADPCAPDPYAGSASANPIMRYYKAADIQLDVTLNKEGWHFPQQRIITLLNDINPTLAGTRPPEPLFFRANSGECIEFQLTNLVPVEYEVDDFQVRTPTDVLGQHIHLVKFDVTSSDGGGNGFNYEDGSLAPEEVQHRIDVIRAHNGCPNGFVQTIHPVSGKIYCPEAEIDPRFGAGPDANCNGMPDWKGAQTTVQRWWADPVLNRQGTDRTLRTVFTHDHFGPSTHQQVGLYAGLVVEPKDSLWYHNETGLQLGTNSGPGNTQDGGPTSWQAVIEPGGFGGQLDRPFREFMIEFADFQLAYKRDHSPAGQCPDPIYGLSDPLGAINPPGRISTTHANLDKLFEKPIQCPRNDADQNGAVDPHDPTCVGDGSVLTDPVFLALNPRNVLDPNWQFAPCPEAVSADDPGTVVVNYRGEPVAMRIQDYPSLAQASGLPGDLSFAYESRTDRKNPEFNKVPDSTLAHVPYPALTSGLVAGDPLTPLIRTYEGDEMQIRVLVGAHEEEHAFSVHNMKWLYEPDKPDSGWKNSQMMGISEYYGLAVGPMPNIITNGTLSPSLQRVVDRLYKPSASAEFQWNGAWGLIRTYQGVRPDLKTLSTNRPGEIDPVIKEGLFREVDPTGLAPQDPAGALTTGERAATLLAPQQLPQVACPPTPQTPRPYDIVAVAAVEALPGNTLTYTRRAASVQHWDETTGTFNGNINGPLHDPTAIMFVWRSDLTWVNQPWSTRPRPVLNSTAPVEPLMLRANAGECIQVRLTNDLPTVAEAQALGFRDLDGWSSLPMIIEDFNANDVAPSFDVGLHPQLVFADPKQSDGSNAGVNPALYGKQTVSPGQSITYYWYAGDANRLANGTWTSRAIEFGATGLSSSDPIQHSNKGAVGALIIEPPGSTWSFNDQEPYLTSTDFRTTRAVADVTSFASGSFKEFTTIFQDDVNLRYSDVSTLPLPWPGWYSGGHAVESMANNEDAQESGSKAFNYRTDPLWYRMGYSPQTPLEIVRDRSDFWNIMSNSRVGGQDPVTPVFTAKVGTPIRWRIVHPGGHTQAHSFEVQGHVWPQQPHNSNSTLLSPTNPTSEYEGVRWGTSPMTHANALLANGAGGRYGATGDYVYKDYVGWALHNGLWGIFRVIP